MAIEAAAAPPERSFMAATGAIVNPNPALAAVVLPFAVPLLLAATLWLGSRPGVPRR